VPDAGTPLLSAIEALPQDTSPNVLAYFVTSATRWIGRSESVVDRIDALQRGAHIFDRISQTEMAADLRQQALRLGWSEEQIVVIDTDLGQSGASAADRAGFQQLVTEVSLGRAGLVLGLEVSRLARNCSDWHRLLEICAFTGTLILDEDGLYDPAHFNDRLLLGLNRPDTQSTSCSTFC